MLSIDLVMNFTTSTLLKFCQSCNWSIAILEMYDTIVVILDRTFEIWSQNRSFCLCLCTLDNIDKHNLKKKLCTAVRVSQFMTTTPETVLDF